MLTVHEQGKLTSYYPFHFSSDSSLSPTHSLIHLPWTLIENESTNSYYLVGVAPVLGSNLNTLLTAVNRILKNKITK